MKFRRPHGFTLVELLVVITIIGMLMALLVPAVGAARAAARRAQCAHQMGEVATAITVYDTRKGEVPGRLNSVKVLSPSKEVGVETVGWPAMLLPDLQQNDIWDRLREGTLVDIPRLDIYLCPSDVQASGNVPGLSFVVNGGYWDARADGPSDYRENGVFHIFEPGLGVTPVAKISLSYVSDNDGMPTTLLLSENIQAGPPESPTDSPIEPRGWLRSRTELGDAFVWVNANPKNPTDGQLPINREKEVAPEYNRQIVGARYCRPSSNHSDGVNAAYCDGHVEFLSDSIDYWVYQQLMTTHGRNARVPPNASAPQAAYLEYLLRAQDYK